MTREVIERAEDKTPRRITPFPCAKRSPNREAPIRIAEPWLLSEISLFSSFPYSPSAVIHRWRGEPQLRSPQPAVNNCAPPKILIVNNLIFTCTIAVNTPGPEDEYRFLNARRLTEDFRSGPGALMQRNSQSLSPASQADRDEPSIRTSILQGLRVQNNAPLNI